MDVDNELSVVDLETRLKMVDVFHTAQPDSVLTHNDQDYYVDHRNTRQLVFEAAPLACVHQIKRGRPPGKRR